MHRIINRIVNLDQLTKRLLTFLSFALTKKKKRKKTDNFEKIDAQ